MASSCVLCGGFKLFDEPEYCITCAFSARAASSSIGLEDWLLRDYAEAKSLVKLGIPESRILEKFLEMLGYVLLEPSRFDKPLDEFKGFLVELAAAQRSSRRIIQSYRAAKGFKVDKDVDAEIRGIMDNWKRIFVGKGKGNRGKSALDMLYIHLQSVFRDMTVGDLKRELCAKKNLDPNVMMVTIKGRALFDSEKLASIQIDEGTMFVLVTRTVGSTSKQTETHYSDNFT